MMRSGIRIVLGVLLACGVWWIGPLLAIGIYRPLGAQLTRQILVVLILLWAFWPLLIHVWSKLAMGPRHVRRPPKQAAAEMPGYLTRRLNDLDSYLGQRWFKSNQGWKARWQARRHGAHRQANPWFLVLGAAGTGKTTLLRRGGISLDGNADLIGRDGDAEGHTVDVNFWHAGDAIWVDINGQWTEVNSLGGTAAQTEWEGLLKALGKVRRKPLLDGVLLCVDCDWLLKAPAETRKRAADSMRSRLSEVSDLLGLRLPVYVAACGIDKLPGAIDFLGVLDDALLEQGMGFGFPSSSGGAAKETTTALYEDGMAQLERRVQGHVQFMAPDAVDASSNSQRLQFVEQLSKLRRLLGDYITRAVFEGNAEVSRVHLRGVWLGSSIDLVDGGVPTLLDSQSQELEAYGARRLAATWNTALRQMIGERGLAAASVPARGRQRVRSAVGWSLALLAIAVASGVLLVGYLTERDYLEQVWANFTEGKSLAERQSADSKPAAALVDVMTQMRYVNSNVLSSNKAVIAPYWEHTRVAGVARDTYAKHLRKSLMPDLYNYVGGALIAQLQGAPGDTYETLKIYLMLARPERRDAEELVRWMNTQWPELAKEGYSDADRREYEEHLRALFGVKGMPATPEDEPLVREARAKASQIPSVTRVIHRIKSGGLPSRVENISLATTGGFMAATMLRMRGDLSATDTVVSAWFTRAGYYDVFKARLQDAAAVTLREESWVLRDQSLQGNTFEIEKAVEKLADAARAQHLQEYIRAWQTFLNDVTVRRYSGMDDAAQIASALADPQSSLAQLLRFVGRETTLTGNYEGNVDSWIDRQKHNIERGRRAIVGELAGERARFRLLPEHVVDDHFEAVRRLAIDLTKTTTSAGSNNPLARLFEPLYKQLSLVNGAMLSGQVLSELDAFSRMRANAARQPEPIRGIMLDLINSGSRAGVSGARNVLSQSAAGASRAFCSQGLQTRYPFVRSAKAEVTVQDFERLFGPQGTMAQQFKEHLAQYVDTSSSPWRARRPDGNQEVVSADVVRAYESAHRIGTAMLDDQGALRMAYMLRVADMDPQIAEFVLEAGGTELRYSHGRASSRQVNWTGKPAGGKLMVRATVHTVDGRSDVQQFDGPWALFRFFDSGRPSGAEVDARETVHQTAVGSVRLRWQSLSTPSPLWSNLLQSFSCPR